MFLYLLNVDGIAAPFPAQAGEIALPVQPSADQADRPLYLTPLRTIGSVALHGVTDPTEGLPLNVLATVMVGSNGPAAVYGSLLLTGLPTATGDRHHVLTETTALAALDLIDTARTALREGLRDGLHPQHRRS
ncbi:hypothetical protein ACIP93_37395 [Streptomyces sp. NPDC088745]|uniref:hypothetical protein n=1 Tax=Streptomyces sp. NPDC088745 TaxID=3365884 RepID=UPI003800F4C9